METLAARLPFWLALAAYWMAPGLGAVALFAPDILARGDVWFIGMLAAVIPAPMMVACVEFARVADKRRRRLNEDRLAREGVVQAGWWLTIALVICYWGGLDAGYFRRFYFYAVLAIVLTTALHGSVRLVRAYLIKQVRRAHHQAQAQHGK